MSEWVNVAQNKLFWSSLYVEMQQQQQQFKKKYKKRWIENCIHPWYDDVYDEIKIHTYTQQDKFLNEPLKLKTNWEKQQETIHKNAIYILNSARRRVMKAIKIWYHIILVWECLHYFPFFLYVNNEWMNGAEELKKFFLQELKIKEIAVAYMCNTNAYVSYVARRGNGIKNFAHRQTSPSSTSIISFCSKTFLIKKKNFVHRKCFRKDEWKAALSLLILQVPCCLQLIKYTNFNNFYMPCSLCTKWMEWNDLSYAQILFII